MTSPKSWYRDSYMISTAPQLIQPAAVNEAFASDWLYWRKSLDEESLRTTLSNSLCFGLYNMPESTSELAGGKQPSQIGLARLITDRVTFAYITDVYVLPEYQGHKLGEWLMACVKEELDSWPHPNHYLLLAHGEKSKEYYRRTLGMMPFEQDYDGYCILQHRRDAMK